MKQLTIIATFDSFLHQALHLAKLINPQKVAVYIRLSQQDQLSERQLQQAQNIFPFELHFFYLNEIEKITFKEGSWVILSCGNSFAETFLKAREQQELTNKIKVITLFAGVILEDESSINARLKSDILLLPSKKDELLANCLANNRTVSCINFGLACEYQRLKVIKRKVENIYYIDQLIIPNKQTHRQKILQSLIALAQKHPHKNFFILSRIIEKERTVWKSQYPLQDFEETKYFPNNLTFCCHDREKVFQKATMILTFTSSIGFEGIKRNIPVRFLNDFGIQPEWRNKVLQQSGLFSSIKNSLDNEFKLNSQWQEDYIKNDPNAKQKLLDLVNDEIKLSKKNIHFQKIQSYSVFNWNYWKLKCQGMKLKRVVR